MIVELYKGLNDYTENYYSEEEDTLVQFFRDQLMIFPINRLRIRTSYSKNPLEISVDVELDDTITNEYIYNRIITKFFHHLNIDLVTLENKGEQSNFGYFFFGETEIMGYQCIFFLDVPKENYVPTRHYSSE